jgi:hypothetical protein
MYILERESTSDQYGPGSLALLSRLLLLKILNIELLEILEVIGA